MPCRIYKLDFQEKRGSNFSLENLILLLSRVMSVILVTQRGYFVKFFIFITKIIKQ